MKDLALTSDLFNNIKFNMQKLILDVPENDARWLSRIFNEKEDDVQNLIIEFEKHLYNESKFAKENFDIPKCSKERTVAFIGDSITSDRASYMNIMKKIYGQAAKIKLIDASVSGDKTDDAVMKLYFRVLNYKPDIVHILLGTNDLRRNKDIFSKSCINLKEVENNIRYLIRTLKENRIEVVISTISPVDNEMLCKRFPDDNWYYVQKDIDDLNEMICAVVKETDAKLNDMRNVYDKYDKTKILLSDGLHLNQMGQRLLLKNVLLALREYL